MQPQDPNNPYAQQPQPPQPPQPQPQAYAQPVAPQAPMPAQPAPAQYAQPQQQYGSPRGAGASLSMISAIVGGVGVLAFAVILGFVMGGSSYWLLLISLAIAAPGAFLGFKSLNEGGSLNKLALLGLVLGAIAVSMSLSFTVSQAIAEHKLKSAESAAAASYSY